MGMYSTSILLLPFVVTFGGTSGGYAGDTYMTRIWHVMHTYRHSILHVTHAGAIVVAQYQYSFSTVFYSSFTVFSVL